MNSDAFLLGVVQVAQALGASPIDLLLAMNTESSLNPAAHNASGQGAWGLIQILTSNLPGVGWTDGGSAFAQLSDVDQLPYVQNFLSRYAQYGLSTPGRVHQALFVPATIEDPANFPDVPDTVIAAASADNLPTGISTGLANALVAAYNANPGFDQGQKGYITTGDMYQTDLSRAANSSVFQDDLARLQQIAPQIFQTAATAGTSILGIGVLAGLGYLLYRNRVAILGKRR